MTPDFSSLLGGLQLNPPTDEHAIRQTETELGLKLPADYVEFMMLSDGAEGFVGRWYVSLWPVETLPTENRTHEAQEYWPGLLLFGTDGGGEVFAFDTRLAAMPVVQVPAISVGYDDVRLVAPDFLSFLERLRDQPL